MQRKIHSSTGDRLTLHVEQTTEYQHHHSTKKTTTAEHSVAGSSSACASEPASALTCSPRERAGRNIPLT
eukprot:11217661-Lingulodinium_polyedra.AAC.1